MAYDTNLPFSFQAIRGKKLTAAFDGGRLSSDGGVMLLTQAARRMGIAEKLAAVIPDPRDQTRVVHPVSEILLARILAIACGYEDADDLDNTNVETLRCLVRRQTSLDCIQHPLTKIRAVSPCHGIRLTTRRQDQREMVMGLGFSSPNQPAQEQTTAYRDGSGPNWRSDAEFANIVGDWEEPSGESRLMWIRRWASGGTFFGHGRPLGRHWFGSARSMLERSLLPFCPGTS